MPGLFVFRKWRWLRDDESLAGPASRPVVETTGYNGTKSAFADSLVEIRAPGEGFVIGTDSPLRVE
jgi:hypothetical protein